MSVVANRSGTQIVVTVTTEVGDILSSVGVSEVEIQKRAMERACSELGLSISVIGKTDAAIDADAAAFVARLAKEKAARPTGVFDVPKVIGK